MTLVTIRDNEGAAPQPYLAWDTVWDIRTGQGDWALAGSDETLNRGGLQAKAGLATAVVLCLFTDRRCPPDHPLARYADDGDRRGWWGDSVDVRDDLGEGELGSLLWLLERSALDDATIRWAQALAEEALAPLVKQGAVARIDVQVEAQKRANRLDIAITLHARDGSVAYAQKYEMLWGQT